MILALIAINSVGWVVIQLSIAAVVTRMGPPHFASDPPLPRVRNWETGLYRKYFHIRRWKHMLPDGTPWVGRSLRKEDLATRNSSDLHRLVVETRRAEAAHWLMMASFPVFVLWNPPLALIVIAVYATLANLPCIIVQRYNRERLQQMLVRQKMRIGMKHLGNDIAAVGLHPDLGKSKAR